MCESEDLRHWVFVSRVHREHRKRFQAVLVLSQLCEVVMNAETRSARLVIWPQRSKTVTPTYTNNDPTAKTTLHTTQSKSSTAACIFPRGRLTPPACSNNSP